MSERIGGSFRVLVAAMLVAAAAALACALLLISSGSLLNGVILASVTIFLLRMFWSATRRKRELVRRGYFSGRRVGTHWVYEELHDQVITSLRFPLEYVGRGAYDIHVPDENAWPAVMPEWARAQREQVLTRLQTVFKFSQIHVESDPAAFGSADG